MHRAPVAVQTSAPTEAWHHRRSRDRNLDIFDKALIRFEQRGGRQHQQRQHQRPLKQKAANSRSLGEIDEAATDGEMSRSYQQYSRSRVTTSNSKVGGSGISGLLPRRTNSFGSDVWGGRPSALADIGSDGFQRQEVFRRSYGQAPLLASSSAANGGILNQSSFYSIGNSHRPGSSIQLHQLGGPGTRRVTTVTETATTSGGAGVVRHPSASAGAASAYFSEGLVINPGALATAQQPHQQQHQYEHQLQHQRHESVGSVEREVLGYHQQQRQQQVIGENGGAVVTRYQQVSTAPAAALPPENVHSEGFLIQRRSVGRWQQLPPVGSEHQAVQQRQQYQQFEQHQEQQHQEHLHSDYPVLRVRQPYKMNFVMSKEAPAAYHPQGGTDAVREQFASDLYHSRGGRQSVAVTGYRQEQLQHQQQPQQEYRVVYHANQEQHQQQGSPRAFAPYTAGSSASTAETQTTLTRSITGGHSTIKEGTIHKQLAAEKKTARQQELETVLSRLELDAGGQKSSASETAHTTTTTTTKTTNHAEHSKSDADAAAAATQLARKQSTVSRVSVQNEHREEESTYFMDGDRLRKRVKRRHFVDGKLVNEKEEVESLTEEERKKVEAQRQQWQQVQVKSANGTASTSGVTTVTSNGGAVVTSSSQLHTSRPAKKRPCACCFPPQRRYKTPKGAAAAGTTTTTTTTTTSGKAGGGKKKQQQQTTTTKTVKTEEQNGGRQVAFNEYPVYN